MNVLYFCHSLNPRTGIGRLVTSIIDQVQEKANIGISLATSEDLLSFNHRLRFFLGFRRLLAEAKKSDLIHAFDAYPYGLLAVFVGWITRKPVILTAVGSGSVQGLARWPKSFFVKLAYKRSRKVTAISRYVKDKITDKISGLTVTVINPGIDYAFWSRADATVSDPRLVGKNYILSVGTFKKRKGYDLSLQIFAELVKRYPDLYYVIVGDPAQNEPYYNEIKSKIDKLGIGERVIIVSNVLEEKLRELYHGARLFILLSREDSGDVEGFGLAFLEAAACGTPVIGTSNSGIEDAMANGQNGYLVDVQNKTDIVAKAEKIIGDENLHRKLGAGSFSWAQQLDARKLIDSYLELYAQIQS